MFPDFFVQAFRIVVDPLKFSMLLLYTLWYDWPIFMISASNEQLQQELEYILLKPDCHSWWISKMQSGRVDTLEERYAIKFCFKLGKNATETCGLLQTAFQPSCMNQDLVPCDFRLFPKLRGCRYETIEEMKEAVTKVIDTLTQEDFHGTFQRLLERYKCIVAGGDYFEGD